MTTPRYYVRFIHLDQDRSVILYVGATRRKSRLNPGPNRGRKTHHWRDDAPNFTAKRAQKVITEMRESHARFLAAGKVRLDTVQVGGGER